MLPVGNFCFTYLSKEIQQCMYITIHDIINNGIWLEDSVWHCRFKLGHFKDVRYRKPIKESAASDTVSVNKVVFFKFTRKLCEEENETGQKQYVISSLVRCSILCLLNCCSGCVLPSSCCWLIDEENSAHIHMRLFFASCMRIFFFFLTSQN